MGMLSFSVAVVDKVDVGLDQKLSMPDVSPSNPPCSDHQTRLSPWLIFGVGNILKSSNRF